MVAGVASCYRLHSVQLLISFHSSIPAFGLGTLRALSTIDASKGLISSDHPRKGTQTILVMSRPSRYHHAILLKENIHHCDTSAMGSSKTTAQPAEPPLLWPFKPTIMDDGQISTPAILLQQMTDQQPSRRLRAAEGCRFLKVATTRYNRNSRS